MKNNVPLVTAIFTMACFFRALCGKYELNIVIIMAFINALSLMFVVAFLVRGIYLCVNEKVNEFSIEPFKKNKKMEKVKMILGLFTVIILTAFGIVYMFYHNASSNDIISIIALGLSIITTEVSEEVGNIIVKFIEHSFIKK